MTSVPPAIIITDLNGTFLIAPPSRKGAPFERSLIYVWSYSQDGAHGIMLNKIKAKTDFASILITLKLMKKAQARVLPEQVTSIPILEGGPSHKSHGFVLHSPEFAAGDTIQVGAEVAMTQSVGILAAMASSQGPKQAVFAVGHAGWGAGQLEKEIGKGAWLVCQHDTSIIFDGSPETKYQRALALMGVDLARLSSVQGRA